MSAFCFFVKSVDTSVIGMQDVFAAEELTTSVTSGDYRQLKESLTAVDVKDAMFVWPYERKSVVNADGDSLLCTQSQNTRKNGQEGLNIYAVMFYRHICI